MSPGSELSRQEKLDQFLEGITDVHQNFDDLLITLSASMQEYDRNNAPINVNPVGGGGECGQGVGIWQILKFFDQIPKGGTRKVDQKCQKKPPPQGKKSKQTIL